MSQAWVCQEKGWLRLKTNVSHLDSVQAFPSFSMVVYIVDVKRTRQTNGSDLWTARVQDSQLVFDALSEETLRETLRVALIKLESEKLGVSGTSIATKMTRTWRVRLEESKEDDDEVSGGWDLFA